jgi:hypothetical protein
MRTWMLEEGADLRYVKDQMGHASIDETEGTYGHLEAERHERRVDIDAILWAWPRRVCKDVTRVAGESAFCPARVGRQRWVLGDAKYLKSLLVEGKGFEAGDVPSSSDLSTPSSQEAAPGGTPRPPASTPPHSTPREKSAPHPGDTSEQQHGEDPRLPAPS